ncbi:MAG: VOC family protein [Salaquimonas sp.]|nr:VOC family protein [Salaquimonas sp.]
MSAASAKSAKTARKGKRGSSPRQARTIDHLVLPVSELSFARERLTALGFTVAPDAQHPFGTENCCVYFKDGTFLEPLGIAQRETCETTALKGNVFTARDQVYRFRRGNNGFSALVFSTKDAKADHARFVKTGISAGKKLKFSRQFEDRKGNRHTMSFRLAFAADLRAPDAFFFTCERVNAPPGGRKAFEKHANGVVALTEVALSEPNPSDFQYLLEEVVNSREINAHSFGIELRAANASVAVYSPAGMKAWYGDERCGHGRGVKLRAATFAVADLEATREVFKSNGVDFREIAGRLVVAPATGQGAIFAFEPLGTAR